MSTGTLQFQYDPFSLEAMTDPQPLYRRLRQDFPVYPLPQYRAWALSRFQDVWDAFLDRDRFTEAEGQVFPRELLEAPASETVPEPHLEPLDIFNNLDPPVHGHVRRAMGVSLLPGAVAKFEPMLRSIVRERLDVLADTGRMDVNHDLASHVSAGAACHVVGLPLSEIPDAISLVNRSMVRAPGQSGITEDGWAAITEITARLKALVARRRAGTVPGDPRMIDGLIAAEVSGRGPLTDDEIAHQLVSILIGGTESLPKVVSGGLRELWHRPDQRAAVAKDPAANAASTFEEMVRMFAPAQWFGRTLKADAEIAGTAMRAGERVLLLTASANRDEREFDDPDTFRWDRPTRRVVAFGMGPHFCIGIHIARLEGRLIVEELLRRFPDYEIDDTTAERAVSEFQIGWVRLPIIVRQ
ncbi:hypothetical protein MB02_07740 [Croceicoccus estronivorus]|uniref:cytochrome P450 n=1 Tax=Croceicoccus estronivorus TaxID=1172626 RepID=UPI00082C3383|nr:cytochrome P450 [Croceicoccus estronivorus]OCC24154.1 hypothetical protein MB02_07740 [Croceicoccus estronivorus]